MNTKTMFWLLWILLLGVGCSGAPEHELAGSVFEPPLPVPDFALAAASNPQVHLSDYQGKYVYLYFGYTFCPDLCPDTLARLAAARRQLDAAAAEQMQVIFISVDPARDTPNHLAEYVQHFDDSFVGLTGTKEEIDAAGAPLGLFYELHEGSEASGYLVDHTSRTYLLDPAGNLIVTYPYDTAVEAFVADLRWLLENGESS